MASSSGTNKFCTFLRENDVPGAKLIRADVASNSVLHLKRWLQCRGMKCSGVKKDLVNRVQNCIASGQSHKIDPSIDGGYWLEEKKKETACSQNKIQAIPLVPIIGWKPFPFYEIPRGFNIGAIYKYLIEMVSGQKSQYKDSSDEMDESQVGDAETSKPMVRGQQYFKCGHVKNIFSHRKDSFFFKGEVLSSFCITKKYNVIITLKNDGSVVDASCECPGSALARCSHIGGLLFAVQDYTITFGYLPVSCTSKLASWNQARPKNKTPRPVNGCNYQSPKGSKNYQSRIQAHEPLTELNSDAILLAIKLRRLILDAKVTNMWCNILEIVYEDYIYDRDGLLMLRMRCEAFCELLPERQLSEPAMMLSTLDQNKSPSWHHCRRGRVTASLAHAVAHSHQHTSLLKTILWSSSNLTNASIAYGNKFENFAKNAYKLAHRKIRVIPSGLWINPQYPGLGATPDAILMDPAEKGFGILEIKCPFLLKDMPLNDAFNKLSPKQLAKFCLEKKRDGYLLKENHQYYSQIQTQMAVCGLTWCDFVVWCPQSGPTTLRIGFNGTFWQSLQLKLTSFHKNVVLPEMVEMRIPRKLPPVDLSCIEKLCS